MSVKRHADTRDGYPRYCEWMKQGEADWEKIAEGQLSVCEQATCDRIAPAMEGLLKSPVAFVTLPAGQAPPTGIDEADYVIRHDDAE
jgi:hypothetical protein